MNQRPMYINGRFLTQQITGTQRYAHELLNFLDSKVAESRASWPEITVLVPRGREPLPSYKAINVRAVGVRQGRVWEQLELPLYSWRGVLFTPCGGAPLIHPRNVITIHDAGVFVNSEAYSVPFRLWYQFLYRALCRTSLHVLTVSKTSKAELERYCQADPDKVSVAYLGSEHATRPKGTSEILEKYGLEKGEFVLAVSSRSRNKNIEGLLEAMTLLDGSLKVVVAGPDNSAVFASPSDLPANVITTGYVSDAERRDLYEAAACFVFPSRYEGFGLPPLEAMAVGCPVVTSNTSSLAELFATVAFMCDPDDPRDIAAQIVRACASGPEYRENCKGFASLFKWERCAEKTWTLIAQLCEAEAKASPVGTYRAAVSASQLDRTRIHEQRSGLAGSR
jgi:glycosyltransferase involved in cell wall biosynthesis